MPRLVNEKNLGNIDVGLSDRIDKAIIARNNMKKKQFITATIEFFLAIPERIQDQLLLRPPSSEPFQAIVARLSDERKGKAPSEARDRKETAEADLKETNAKLKELELKIRQGEYIPREKVEQGRNKRVLAVRRRLLALSKKLPPLLKNQSTSKMKQIIRREVGDCINAFAAVEQKKK